MEKRYVVCLTQEEREELRALVKKGKVAAYRIKHAHILLAVDEDGLGWTDEQAANAFHCHLNTVKNVRVRLVEQGLEGALERKAQARPSRERSLDGEGEARLISIACSQPPEGRVRWTLQMLAEELVTLNVVESVSAPTVLRTLKKTHCIPTCINAG